MTIEQIERRLAHEFPSKKVMLTIDIRAGYGQSTISIMCEKVNVEHCRSINNAIETLKERLAPARVGHVEIEA